MKTRSLLSCFAAVAFAVTAKAQSPDQPRRPDPHQPPMDQHRGGPPHGRGDHHKPDAQGDIHARLNHLKEAIQHLRAAGINEPAASLEQMAREMQEQIQRQQHEAGGSMRGGRPPAASAELEAMHKEMRSLAHQVQELRNLMQNQRGDQQRFARPVETPRDGERRPETRDGPPRRPEGGERRRDGDQGEQAKERPQGESRREAPRDGAPRPPAEPAPPASPPVAPKP